MTIIKNPRSETGFTIIELMIATAVLSIILVMLTVIMISIGNLYYKGLNQSRIQDSTRTIADDIGQHLKLGDSLIPAPSVGSEGAYCVGSTRYTYVMYKQISDNPAPSQTRHVLWRDTNPTPGSCPTALLNMAANPPSSGGTELITPNSRLTDFSISSASPYTIVVGEAYGDDDLICDVGYPGDCTNTLLTAHMAQIIAGTIAPSGTGAIHCKGNIGDQFCATSNLTTTVVQRLP